MEESLTKSQRRPPKQLRSEVKADERLKAVISRYQSHPEFLGLAIEDVNQPGAVDDTLLHIAARKGELADMEILIASGANINVSGDLGYTPLHAAAMGGHLDAVRKLLAAGADARIKNEDGDTPEKLAAVLGNTEVAEFLERRRRRLGKCGG